MRSAPTTPLAAALSLAVCLRVGTMSQQHRRDEETRRERKHSVVAAGTAGSSIRRRSEYMPERKGTGKTAAGWMAKVRVVRVVDGAGWAVEAMMCVCAACVSVFGRGARA